MSNTSTTSQKNKNWTWLPILTSGLCIGVCSAMMISIGLIKKVTPTTKTHYYLAVNAYYAGCLQNQKEKASKKFCQAATEYYAYQLRVINNE